LEHFDELSENEHSPIHALTYAIRRIMHAPSFLSRIPELLDYLWHVDKFRKRAVEISSQIMTWQKFYKNDAANKVRLLSAKEEKMVAGFEDQKKVAGGREAFCECTIRCCRLVSHHRLSWLYISLFLNFNSTYITSALRRNRACCLHASQPSFLAFRVEMVKQNERINFTGIFLKKSGQSWMKQGENLCSF
jgi:hypothetical protein